MSDYRLETIDLKFQGVAGVIAAYLVLYDGGAVLIESGPASTLPALLAGLESHGVALQNLEALLLTHIHLDHAGAAGWFARQGVRVYVHPRGAPHLIDPQRLLASATRIYGDQMDRLWGPVHPAPDQFVQVLADGEEVRVGPLSIQALDTPGHAWHHLAYLLDGVCFSGDVGGVRLPGSAGVEPPMPPPELHLPSWRASLARLGGVGLQAIAPTHFGVYSDVKRHLAALATRLDEVEAWLEKAMVEGSSAQELGERFTAWQRTRRGGTEGVGGSSDTIEQNLVNPPSMSAQGLFRYWRKYRASPGAEG